MFTIITPTWNQAQFIRDCIDSVLNQTYRDFEYIIVDNCSDDGTEDIVREYMQKDSRITYIREPDKGQAEAINKGLKLAKGEYVAWLNSDDLYINDEVFSRVAEAFEKNPDSGLVLGDAWYCDKSLKPTVHNPSDRKAAPWLIRRWYYIMQPAVFWRNKGELLDTKYHYVFDWKFFIKAFKKEQVFFTHEDYAFYRMYEDNKTGQNNAKRKFEIYRLQQELNDSRANVAFCRMIYRLYAAAEKRGHEKAKAMIDFFCRVVFHLSGKRLVSF